jgi:hypothetical protein
MTVAGIHTGLTLAESARIWRRRILAWVGRAQRRRANADGLDPGTYVSLISCCFSIYKISPFATCG